MNFMKPNLPVGMGMNQASDPWGFFYQTLFDGVDLLVTARTEPNLLKKFCALLVNSGLFMGAHIQEMAGQPKPMRNSCACATFNARAFFRVANRRNDDDQFPRIKTIAWRSKKTVISNNYSHDPRFPSMNAIGQKLGIGAAAAMLIVRNRRPWAVLCVLATEPDSFDTEIIRLLERLAAMVGHILGKFDTKAAPSAAKSAKSANPLGFGRALLNAGALRILYQPIQNLATGAITSVEALARLESSARLIPPLHFLPGLLQQDRQNLFEQVLITSLQQLRAWDAENLALTISVNVDAQILLQDRTLPFIRKALTATAIAPRRLTLELLETHDLIDAPKARRLIDAVRATGIRLALDDLGAGYSSILKLRDLPLDIVKLDRAFVAGLRDQPDNLMFVSIFQTLTTSRNITLIVEGVASDDVLDALRVMGVPYAQGYLIARPMHAARLTTWLRAQTPSPRPRHPNSLIGAYAVHLGWQRVFNGAHDHTSLMRFFSSTNTFSLSSFFEAHKLQGTPLHESYLALQAIIQSNPPDRDIIANAAAILRQNFITALKTNPAKPQPTNPSLIPSSTP